MSNQAEQWGPGPEAGNENLDRANGTIVPREIPGMKSRVVGKVGPNGASVITERIDNGSNFPNGQGPQQPSQKNR